MNSFFVYAKLSVCVNKKYSCKTKLSVRINKERAWPDYTTIQLCIELPIS